MADKSQGNVFALLQLGGIRSPQGCEVGVEVRFTFENGLAEDDGDLLILRHEVLDGPADNERHRREREQTVHGGERDVECNVALCKVAEEVGGCAAG